MVMTKDGMNVNANVLLRQISDEWLIYGMDLSVAGMSFTMNFEDPDSMYEELLEQTLAMMPAEMRSAMTPEMKQQKLQAMKEEAKKYQ